MTESVYVDLLEKELEKPITTAKQSYRIIQLTALGLVSMYREQYSISKELYGNGVPGGLKLELGNVQTRLVETQKDVNDLKKLWSSSVTPPNQPSTKEETKEDSFKGVVKWFVDKILPTLVIALLLATFNIILWLIAVKNGWIHL